MSQLLTGIKILVSSTSVKPSRHWAGFDHDEDVVSKWEGEGWIGVGLPHLDLVFACVFVFLMFSDFFWCLALLICFHHTLLLFLLFSHCFFLVHLDFLFLFA